MLDHAELSPRRAHETQAHEAPAAGELPPGLLGPAKSLPSIYLYDGAGSELFERICTLPEYYPTRTETQILRDNVREIAECVGPHALLLELGSGASVKTQLLLEHLEDLVAYMPVDISRTALLEASQRLRWLHPALEILPVCADFTRPFTPRRPQRRAHCTLVFFPGSTIGNFETKAAIDLLRDVRIAAGADARLLVGADLVKDPEVLRRAYDDSQGVTAAFNLNALRHLNRELGANFNLEQFRHAAIWNSAKSRIEMHLISTARQCVRIGEAALQFERGEHLVTELCHKYTIERFSALAAASGWTVERCWTDERRLFSVHYCRATPHDELA
ncbi:MAG TPA: L-histidine N(alpha)-methyltransferase [Steroidobacteraceae bacterium]